MKLCGLQTIKNVEGDYKMRKKLCLCAAVMMLSVPMVVSAAVHTHVFGSWKYVGTTQTGSYTHQYVAGHIQGETTPVYGTCTVCSEDIKYKLKCNTCDATYERYKTESYDCHGACGLGDVEN